MKSPESTPFSPDLDPPEPDRLADPEGSHGDDGDQEALSQGETDPGWIDDALLLRGADGDEEALTLIYLGSVRWLRTVLARTEAANQHRWGSLGLDDLPHDIIERVFRRDLESLQSIAVSNHPTRRYFALLATALNRAVIDRHRAWRSRHAKHLLPTDAEGDPPFDPMQVAALERDGSGAASEYAVSQELAALIDRLASEVLTEEERALLEMVIDEVPRETIALVLGVGYRAANTRICRVRKKLRERLDQEWKE